MKLVKTIIQTLKRKMEILLFFTVSLVFINFGTDKIAIYRYKVIVFLSQNYRFCEKVAVYVTYSILS